MKIDCPNCKNTHDLMVDSEANCLISFRSGRGQWEVSEIYNFHDAQLYCDNCGRDFEFIDGSWREV